MRAGIQVAERAARGQAVHLELGGKAPVVVFDDADIEAAVEGIAIAGYFNAGQDCTARDPGPRRRRHPRRLRRRARGIRQGQRHRSVFPDADALFGPVNNANQLARSPASSTGCPRTRPSPPAATGSPHSGDGCFLEPTVVSGLRQDDEAIQNEIFGPVITVQRFADEDEAVAFANGVDYGLASSVWTKDFGKAMRMSKRLDFGCVWINTHIPLVAEMPHGGFKRSGYGKDLSMYGFEDYTRIKHVMANIESPERLSCPSAVCRPADPACARSARLRRRRPVGVPCCPFRCALGRRAGPVGLHGLPRQPPAAVWRR